MKEYHELQNTVYENHKQVKIELNRFNYYCANRMDGTLLHCAAGRNFIGYVELLLKDRFDTNMQNRHQREETPVSLAKHANNVLILSLLGHSIQCDNKEKNTNLKWDDAKEKETEKETSQEKEEEMDVQSLSLRYDSFTNSFMSSIYFLKCLGFDNIYARNDNQLTIRHELV